MKSRFLISGAALIGLVVGYAQYGGAQKQVQTAAAPASAPASTQRALLDKYCISCHSDSSKTGGLSLQSVDVSKVAANPELWERVVRKLRAGVMPPPAVPRPD